MLELDQEARFAGAWGAQPVTDCHAASWLVLVAGEDLIGSFIALARSPGAHVYGPMVLARAALEACARAKWLAAPGIGVRRRVARGETERLYSAVEINKIRRAMNTDVDDEVRTQILAEAERQGFTKKSRSGQSVVSFEEYRPTATECFRQLFGISDGFGETMFRYWSAASHGPAYGLLGSLESLGHPMVSTGGLVPMGMKTSSDDIVFLVRALVLGYRTAVLAQRDLFGWTSEASGSGRQRNTTATADSDENRLFVLEPCLVVTGREVGADIAHVLTLASSGVGRFVKAFGDSFP